MLSAFLKTDTGDVKTISESPLFFASSIARISLATSAASTAAFTEFDVNIIRNKINNGIK
jgi:hypothetical protein